MNNQQELPITAIIGRPNVGKSSLFNLLVGKRISIVHEESGVTRDRVVSPVQIQGHHFMLADTGGLGVFNNQTNISNYEDLIRRQVQAAVEEADCLIWVVDSESGIAPLDREIADLLRRAEAKNVIIAANKADNRRLAEAAAGEFASSEFEPAVPVSCSHGTGVEELLRRLFTLLPRRPRPEAEQAGMKLAVVGRPNVGKSSLINGLLGEERVIVSETAGTTRDAIDIPIEIIEEEERVYFTLIDTAGLRQRRRVDTPVELFSVMRAENAIKRCDVAILVLDGTEGVSSQDRRVARMINQQHKPCIIVANKWDLAGCELKMQQLRADINESLPFMSHSPIIALCAVSGYNFNELLNALFTLREHAQARIPTSLLNQFLHDLIARTPPAAVKQRRLKFFYATMVDNPPPRFLLFVNEKKLCRPNYRSFLANQLQSAFFPKTGLPVVIELRPRREMESGRTSSSRPQGGKKRSKPSLSSGRERRSGAGV